MSDERSEGLQGGVGDSSPDNLLDSFDQVIASLPPGDPIRRDLLELRPQISDQQETMVEARRMIEKLEEVDQKSDFACEPHRHISRSHFERNGAHRGGGRGLLLQRRSAHSTCETKKGNARAGKRSVRDRWRSRI